MSAGNKSYIFHLQSCERNHPSKTFHSGNMNQLRTVSKTVFHKGNPLSKYMASQSVLQQPWRRRLSKSLRLHIKGWKEGNNAEWCHTDCLGIVVSPPVTRSSAELEGDGLYFDGRYKRSDRRGPNGNREGRKKGVEMTDAHKQQRLCADITGARVHAACLW